MKKTAGFTMIELLIVIVIIGIGFSLAVPSFQGMLARNRVATQTNELLLAVNLARSEASRVGGLVALQAADPTAGDEFGEGFCVLLWDADDPPEDCEDPVIRRFAALDGTTTLAGIDDAANGGDWDSPREVVLFNGLGALSGTANQLRVIDLCLEGQRGLRIQIALIGRPKAWKQAEAGDPSPPSIQPDC